MPKQTLNNNGDSIDELKFLGETKHGCIFICEEGLYHLHFNNLMLKMNREDFLLFNKVVNDCPVEDTGMQTYLGKEVLIRCAAVSNIHFGFTFKELDELKKLFAEAVFMDGIFELTNPEKLKDLI